MSVEANDDLNAAAMTVPMATGMGGFMTTMTTVTTMAAMGGSKSGCRDGDDQCENRGKHDTHVIPPLHPQRSPRAQARREEANAPSLSRANAALAPIDPIDHDFFRAAALRFIPGLQQAERRVLLASDAHW